MTDDEIAELHEKWWQTQNNRFDAMKYAMSEDAFVAGFKSAARRVEPDEIRLR